ncbi:cupin domain-containing protein [Methylorubrum thiocyanatum]
MLDGELVLIRNGTETPLHAGDAAAFPKKTGNGHHLIDHSKADVVYLEVGSRNPEDVTSCSDVDVMSTNAEGRLLCKDGMPYAD